MSFAKKLNICWLISNFCMQIQAYVTLKVKFRKFYPLWIGRALDNLFPSAASACRSRESVRLLLSLCRSQARGSAASASAAARTMRMPTALTAECRLQSRIRASSLCWRAGCWLCLVPHQHQPRETTSGITRNADFISRRKSRILEIFVGD
jgi:hypothetical protein